MQLLERREEVEKSINPKSLQSTVIKNENLKAAGCSIRRPLNEAFKGIAGHSLLTHK